MKAIVLGGTGFVGMNVVRTLVREGHDVVATRRNRANTLFARKLGARLERAELDDVDSMVAAMQGREVVFHCAGHYPRYSLEPDGEVEAARRETRNVVRAAMRAGVQRLVLTSSVATVGKPRGGRELADERDAMDPRAGESVYFGTKAVIEHEVLRAAHDGLDVVIACPGGIVGELDVKAGTGFLLVALAHGMLPFYVQGLTNIVDADDMARGQVAVAERGRTGERYILGGHNVTVRGLVDLACDELGVRFCSWPLPLWLARPLSTFDEMRCVAQGRGARPLIPREFVDIVTFSPWFDTTKARRELGLPAPTPLPATLRKACAWYERFRYIPRRNAVGEGASQPSASPASSTSTQPRAWRTAARSSNDR